MQHDLHGAPNQVFFSFLVATALNLLVIAEKDLAPS